MTEWWQWAILIGANIPVYLGIGWAIFRTWEDFAECLGYWFTPDAWSWIKGEWMEDTWAELRLFVFFALCAGVVWGEYVVLGKIFGW